MTDLFEDVFSNGRPTNIEESSSRITEVLNIIRMTKTKEIYSKVAEEHIEKILVYCLIRRDYNEFMIEWAKTKTDHMMENSLLDDSDEDEGLDFEKTITKVLHIKFFFLYPIFQLFSKFLYLSVSN